MKSGCAVVKTDFSLLNLNMIVLHSGGAEAVMFRLFYSDSNGESVDFQLPSPYVFVSKR